MTNIETIRAALLGIVSKTEREEAIAALEDVERVIELTEDAFISVNEKSHFVPAIVQDALAEIKKLKGE